MKKRIIAIVSAMLVFTMLFTFTGCFGEDEEETTTTVKARTPLPTDVTSSLDEESRVVTGTDYSPEQLVKNTATIFEYFNVHINELKSIKASVSMSRDKSISEIENTKTTVDENGEQVEETEKVPMSDNEYVNIAIKNLDEYMLDQDGANAEYGDDLKGFLPVKGESYVSKLTLDEVESATCVDSEGERTITVILKSPTLPATIEKAYDMGNVDEVMAEFAKANAYMKAEKPTLTYKNCSIVIKADVETDEVTSIEYIKNIDVATQITGEGNLESIGTLPVQFCYHDSVKYEIDRTDPSVSTSFEAE